MLLRTSDPLQGPSANRHIAIQSLLSQLFSRCQGVITITENPLLILASLCQIMDFRFGLEDEKVATFGAKRIHLFRCLSVSVYLFVATEYG